jgi:hypothetical protein
LTNLQYYEVGRVTGSVGRQVVLLEGDMRGFDIDQLTEALGLGDKGDDGDRGVAA